MDVKAIKRETTNLQELGFWDTELFRDVGSDERAYFTSGCATETRLFGKGCRLIDEGSSAFLTGYLSSGIVLASKLDACGKNQIFSVRTSGDLFGIDMLFSEDRVNRLCLTALENTIAVLFDLEGFLAACEPALKVKLLENAARVLATEKGRLIEKADILSYRKTRDRILCFIRTLREREGSNIIPILLNREQLADYICVDRSGLICELQRLQDEGILEVAGSHFVLKREDI
jgi:CRP-like cAMP-binding protein